MKKHLLILVFLVFMLSIAMAQQPATIKKSDNDTLCNDTRLSVEIISVSGFNLDHPTHPATGISCPFSDDFTTSQTYSWYLWESSYFSPQNDETIVVHIDSSGYIKVTVGDNYGHTGSDSIWFNVRNANVPPMENFIMEIDDDLHANFFGIAVEEHHRLRLSRSCDHMHYYDINNSFISSGEWSYVDTNVTYSDDSLWLYDISVYDICGSSTGCMVPGVLLSTREGTYGRCYIDFKSLLQGSFYQNYVYIVYSVDRNGNRHPVTDENGDPVILDSNPDSWDYYDPNPWHVSLYISPDMVAHPFYQCGVARTLEDGSYELVSLSNKVVNPYYPYYPYPYESLHIEDIEDEHTYDYCLYQYGSLPLVALLGETDCPQQSWELESNGEHFSQTIDSLAIAIPDVTQRWDVTYHGCDRDVSFHVLFYIPDWDNPFAAPFVWKHNGEAVGLAAVDDESYASGDIACHWSTGETTNHIEATEVGTYSVSISAHGCSDAYSMKLRDNVEIALATVDLKTGRDKVTWRVDPEQADYIDKVKVIRYDGSAYSAPYAQGHYLFSSIEDVARNYHIVAVSKEGQDCPVASYERGTVHATYEQDIDGYLNIRWNTPYMEAGAPTELAGFQICLYNASTEAVTVVDEVDATATDYTGDASQYAGGGEVVVAAVFGDGSRSFSNLYTMLAVGEDAVGGFDIYPNPSKGRVTVEGTGRMTVTNALGQTVMVKEIDGKGTVELPQGLYLLKLGGTSRKVVVE